jgi:2-polyprenyl-3-methyl-5-hydroxy-6-metoxy-1,4-benzoquinol methylase
MRDVRPDTGPHPLEKYLAQFVGSSLIEELSRRTEIPRDRIGDTLRLYIAEARFGYGMISPRLPLDGRILEVGSGLGILSGYLKLQGYEVTLLEPCANGFDMFARMLSVLVENGCSPPALCIKAEELCPEKHGRYDFIFSVNVLEHIPDLEAAMTGMIAVLADRGSMFHTCPNYAVPYEPHLALPLIPFFPHATRWLLPKSITSGELWQSINFISVSRVRRFVTARSCTVTFRRGTMAASLRRQDFDAEFARRHRGFGAAIYRVLKLTGLLKVIEILPPVLSTPMIFEVRKNAKDGNVG